MQNFERNFEEFCKSPGIDSGKARSYAKAVRYLCDYMEIYEINDEAINKIKLIENNIKDKNCGGNNPVFPFHREFLRP